MGDMFLAVYPLTTLTPGSGDKKIAIWDTQQPVREKSITPIHKLDAKSFGVPNVVAIDPRSALLATASTELVFLPQRF
jgi:hypothetical protein